MAHSVEFFSILLPLLFLLSIYAAINVAGKDTDKCRELRCDPGGPVVRFPFRIKGKHPRRCGYTGFEISCSSTNDSILQLPDGSADLSVLWIDYSSQQLSVKYQTARSCLPKKHHTYNLSSSPFQLDPSYKPFNVTYFNCSTEIWERNRYSISNCPLDPATDDYMYSEPWPIDCPAGDQRYTVVAFGPVWSACFLLGVMSCNKFYNAEVTYDYFDISLEVQLSWTSPNCTSCEAHGKCIPKKNKYSEPEIDCLLPNYHNNNNSFSPSLQPPNNNNTGTTPTLRKIIVTFIVLGSFSLLVAAIVLYLIYTSDKAEKENQIKVKKFLEDYKALTPSRYSYAFIKRITNEFKDQLGQGAYGTVFKGMVSNEIPVAVKILNTSKTDGEEFVNEVGTIGKIHHVNVVRLVGFCADGLKRALVYDYFPNGSLEKFVTKTDDKNNFLGWKKLHEIALGIAKGIEYLHQGCDQRILHFDIKPCNILLDQNLIPKISDFGLAKLCSKDQSIVSMTTARGTIGYIAPEVFSRNFGNVSYKSDVYSFGMLLLEMVGGRKNVNLRVMETDEVYYPEWIYNLLEKEEDLRIEIEEEGDAKIAKKLAVVGLKCIQWHPVDRPSMKRVVQMLELGEESDLSLPPNPFASSADTRRTNALIPARNIVRVKKELDVISESLEQEIEEISESE